MSEDTPRVSSNLMELLVTCGAYRSELLADYFVERFLTARTTLLGRQSRELMVAMAVEGQVQNPAHGDCECLASFVQCSFLR